MFIWKEKEYYFKNDFTKIHKDAIIVSLKRPRGEINEDDYQYESQYFIFPQQACDRSCKIKVGTLTSLLGMEALKLV